MPQKGVEKREPCYPPLIQSSSGDESVEATVFLQDLSLSETGSRCPRCHRKERQLDIVPRSLRHFRDLFFLWTACPRSSQQED